MLDAAVVGDPRACGDSPLCDNEGLCLDVCERIEPGGLRIDFSETGGDVIASAFTDCEADTIEAAAEATEAAAMLPALELMLPPVPPRMLPLRLAVRLPLRLPLRLTLRLGTRLPLLVAAGAPPLVTLLLRFGEPETVGVGVAWESCET